MSKKDAKNAHNTYIYAITNEYKLTFWIQPSTGSDYFD